jgi:hypothetical protein
MTLAADTNLREASLLEASLLEASFLEDKPAAGIRETRERNTTSANPRADTRRTRDTAPTCRKTGNTQAAGMSLREVYLQEARLQEVCLGEVRLQEARRLETCLRENNRNTAENTRTPEAAIRPPGGMRPAPRLLRLLRGNTFHEGTAVRVMPRNRGDTEGTRKGDIQRAVNTPIPGQSISTRPTNIFRSATRASFRNIWEAGMAGIQKIPSGNTGIPINIR